MPYDHNHQWVTLENVDYDELRKHLVESHNLEYASDMSSRTASETHQLSHAFFTKDSKLLNITWYIGDRVEIGPHHDLWMQGDRYGTIETVGDWTVTVKMDKTKKLLLFGKDAVTRIESPRED